MPERFYVIARDETEYWRPEVLERIHAARAFGLYLVREDEATYCCSLTPSSFAMGLKNEFAFDLPPDFDRDDSGPWEDEVEALEREGVEDSYWPLVDVSKLDKREVVPIEWSDEDVTDILEEYETHEDGIAALWEATREAWVAQPDIPTCVWSDFEAWNAERVARLRAENRPPEAHPTLPLFTHQGA